MPNRLALIVAVLATVPLFSQGPGTRDGQTPAQAGNASLSGTAQITISGQRSPVRRARVHLQQAGGTVATTDTDTKGEFRFDKLTPGSYRVLVDKPGFVPIGRDPIVDVTGGQATRVTVAMQRGAAIEGRLVTPDGEAAMGMTVSAVRLGFGPYGRKVVAQRQTTTDDLGRFRLHTLMPGEYYIEAMVDPLRILGAAATPGQKPARTFFAGTARLNEARLVSVQAEQQLSNISFTVATVDLAIVTGSVTTAEGKPPASFSMRIQRVGSPAGEVRCLLPSSRTFQCPNVPPGDFWLLVAARSAPDAAVEYSITRLNVEGRNLTDLAVTTRSGVPVSGRIEVEGGAALPPNLQFAALETEFELPAPAVGASVVANPPVTVAAGGAFTFASLAGARLFRMDRLPEGWAVKSVWIGDTEISDTPTTLTASDPAPSVRVVLTSQTGSVEGAVTRDDKQPAAGARVVVFSDDARRWGARSRFIKTVEVNTAGRYRITGLLPGSYRLACVELLDDGAWEDPEVLAKLAPIATAFVVKATERQTVDWRMR